MIRSWLLRLHPVSLCYKAAIAVPAISCVSHNINTYPISTQAHLSTRKQHTLNIITMGKDDYSETKSKKSHSESEMDSESYERYVPALAYYGVNPIAVPFITVLLPSNAAPTLTTPSKHGKHGMDCDAMNAIGGRKVALKETLKFMLSINVEEITDAGCKGQFKEVMTKFTESEEFSEVVGSKGGKQGSKGGKKTKKSKKEKHEHESESEDDEEEDDDEDSGSGSGSGSGSDEE